VEILANSLLFSGFSNRKDARTFGPSACDAVRLCTRRARGLQITLQPNPYDMASSGAPVAFMLRCRQASAIPSRNVCLRRPPLSLQLHRQPIRAASTSAQASSASPPPAPPRREPSIPRRSTSPQHLQPGASSTSQTLTPQRLNLWTSFKSFFGFKPPSPISRINVFNNPYRARKKWPPNFKTLHPKHQFHYEKTYRRRLKLKYIRPRWVKGTKLVQYVLMTTIVLYWIFFLQIEGREGTIFDAVSVHLSKDSLLWVMKLI
jgi:hypothetical protein